MSQELWRDIPQDLFIKTFIEDVQSWSIGVSENRGILLWYKLMKICKRWKYLILEVMNIFPGFHLNISYIRLENRVVSLLANIKILDLASTYVCDKDLKLLSGVTRIVLYDNNQITNKGLSHLKNIEYLDIRNTRILINNELLLMLPKLKILVVTDFIHIYNLMKILGISDSKLQIRNHPLPNWWICQLE